MLDATGKKLLRLLQPEQATEIRGAAALVLGEVGGRDSELARGLCAALDDPDPSVRAQVIRAVGRLRIEPAQGRLLDRVKLGGEEAELAAQAAARLGAKGTQALQDLMPQVAPGLRRRIATALAAAGTTNAELAAVDALLDKDPGVVDAAAQSLIGQIPALSAAHRQALADHLLELLRNQKKVRLPVASETAVVRLLAGLAEPPAEALLWERTQPTYPVEVRAAALQALGRWSTTPSKDRLQRLFACAAAADFRVAAPALMLLKALPLSERVVPDWLTLLQAPDVAVRRLAIEKLGDRDSPKVAAALVQQLRHPDRVLRDEAVACLARGKHGRQALAQALREAGSPDEAWMLARIQAPLARDYPPELREQLFAQAFEWLETNDRRAAALIHLLREADAHQLRDRLAERALALRKKKAYAPALIYLRLLASDPACGAPLRLELAGCGLKVSSHDLSAEARAADPCLQQFARLIPSHPAELTDFLEQAKWLEAEDLFYLGFHFAEKDRQGKEFGGQVLRLLVRRGPRSKIARDARSKLQREGLE